MLFLFSSPFLTLQALALPLAMLLLPKDWALLLLHTFLFLQRSIHHTSP